jgi:hypothetical protein
MARRFTQGPLQRIGTRRIAPTGHDSCALTPGTPLLARENLLGGENASDEFVMRAEFDLDAPCSKRLADVMTPDELQRGPLAPQGQFPSGSRPRGTVR